MIIKLFILFLLNFQILIACSGDCLMCHPALKETIKDDYRHKPMLDCIRCHENNVGNTNSCGDDCFSCHSIEKIKSKNIKEHNVIDSCIQCHTSLTKDKLNPFQGNTLKSVLYPTRIISSDQ